MTGSFTVFDQWADLYVRHVDRTDGDLDYTNFPEHAGIFHGEAWLEFFADDGKHKGRYRLIPYELEKPI